ncbi:hypothetical protein FJ973_06545 [Mesorhizobium sp. B2-1-3]|uniref:hypothetical protein n=1 Tax=Mesorhizobium sp. B2-1-3 TaxID=2589972 RepID=UPI00112A989E|nr:hypothetical protein [Mesorhizobium sp. B2-1-3]TPN16339.1 hypothetical protein FJ973_06545 [Mesorhizobium sp. B2-1-3]
MTRAEARAALIRQLDGMSAETAELARDTVRICDAIEDDDDYVNDAQTFMRTLQFVEYMMTGVRPKTDTVQ